jgi:hypothetical protein
MTSMICCCTQRFAGGVTGCGNWGCAASQYTSPPGPVPAIASVPNARVAHHGKYTTLSHLIYRFYQEKLMSLIYLS